jgi:hypothetical protein
MAGKLSGSAIQSGTITTAQLASEVSDVISQGGGPKITSIAYANSALAADNSGNSVVIVTGTGFNSGVSVYVNGVVSPTVTRANSNSLSFVVPANTQGSTVPFYVVNTDGGSAVYFPGITISGPPTWLTSATVGTIVPNTEVSLPPLFAYTEGDLTPIYATGGTVQNVNNYTIHTFTSTDTFSVSSGGGEIEFLIVAAGGGGGHDMGGGGGGGGVLANTVNVTATNYTITIGAGGAGSVGPYNGTPVSGSNGGNSSIGTDLIAVGGGGAGSGHRTDAPYVGGPARDGGSGGGASAMYRYGSAGQANGGNVVYHSTLTWQLGTRGGKSPETQASSQYYAGGGGGAGGNTANAGMSNGTIDAVSSTRPGHGGDGYLSNISGTEYYYAGGGAGNQYNGAAPNRSGNGGYGGGGGGGYYPGYGSAGYGGTGGTANGSNGSTAGGAGGTNTGGGGGGGGHQYNGGSGGSGTIVIKYPKNDTVVSNLNYTLVSGSLPPGVNLESNGIFTGNVTNPANSTTTYSFTVSAGPDAENQYAEKTFNIIVSNPSLKATGGTITDSGNYRIHTFTESGTFEITQNPNSLNVEYLVVGGGGGGGETIGGGGGGGNVQTGNITSAAVQTYTVTVGAGGAGGWNGNNQSYPGGVSGNNSSITASGVSVTANGGGAGGGFSGGGTGTGGGHGGGQGAGGGPAVAAGPGNNAGGTSGTNNNSGAGGGGAGGTGSPSTSGSSGAGGLGISSSISGTLAYYAGGGGGGARDPSGGNGAVGGSSIGGTGGTGAANGSAGVVNTGSGGGGGGYRNSPQFEGAGGNGGSGIVILRYELT